MGKTVKSRTIMSIASFLLCAALCLVANTSIPKIYESYKQKAVAQQAASQATHQIKKEAPVVPVEEPVIPEETTEDTSFEDTSFDDTAVYDVPEDTTPVEKYEEPAAEEPKEEEAPAEDVEEPETEETAEEEKEEDNGGFFGIIISLITGIIEKITSLDVFGKIKDFLGDILKFFGIEL